MEHQLLYPPIRRLGSVDFVLRGTRERMRTGELAEIASRPANHAQNLAIECHLEDATWVCRLPNEQHLMGTWRNADRVGSSDYLLEAITCRCSAIDRPRRRISRNIDRKHAPEIAIDIKDLDAMVRTIANINIVLQVDGDRVWQIELTGAGTLRSVWARLLLTRTATVWFLFGLIKTPMRRTDDDGRDA